MPKKIRRDFPIYIAPNIVGFYEGDNPIAIDQKPLKKLNPYDINDKIHIYERQVSEWFLNIANQLSKGDHNGFIVLMICLSYFEGVQQYIDGQSSEGRSSKQFFKLSIHRVYPHRFSNVDLDELYKEARCGLFHNGMVSGKIIINNSFEHAIDFPDNDTIRISPKKLLDDVKKDFGKYISELRNEHKQNIRNSFDTMFSVV